MTNEADNFNEDTDNVFADLYHDLQKAEVLASSFYDRCKLYEQCVSDLAQEFGFLLVKLSRLAERLSSFSVEVKNEHD